LLQAETLLLSMFNTAQAVVNALPIPATQYIGSFYNPSAGGWTIQ